MNILVTGGAGYIGSHTAKQLLDAGYKVVVFDNLSTGFRTAVPEGCAFVQGDIRDTDTVEKTIREFKADAVIHFAAKLIVPESVVAPLDYYENNTLGMLSLLRASQAAGMKKIVFSSTAAVYGDGGDSMVTEASPINPVSPYGSSKRMCEQLLADSNKAYGIRSVILRYFNVAGASVDGKNGQRTRNATHLIKVAAEAACGKRAAVDIFGTDYETPDGTGIRDYIHVEDLASIHVSSVQYLVNGGESVILNCGYGRGFSVREVLRKMKEVSGIDFVVHEKPRRWGDADRIVANPEKMNLILNWKPKYASIDEICRSAFQWEVTSGGSLNL